MKAKKISLVMLAMACIAAMAITSCSKSSGGSSGPTTIGGYVSSDSVASSNLVAYWPLDGNGNDTKGGGTGTVNGGSFTTGIRGQSYQGDTTGTYISCVANSALASLTSFTVSVWIKTPPPTKKPGQNNFALRAQGIMFMGSADPSGQGELVLENDNSSASQRANDTAVIHNGFFAPNGSPNQFFIPAEYVEDTSTIGWMHLVMTYDGSSSNFVDYVNGTPNGANLYGPYVLSNQVDVNGSGSTPLGNLNYSSKPPAIITIGAWPALSLFGLDNTHSFAGNIDELRIYNRALTQQEITGLYLNGRAGR